MADLIDEDRLAEMQDQEDRVFDQYGESYWEGQHGVSDGSGKNLAADVRYLLRGDGAAEKPPAEQAPAADAARRFLPGAGETSTAIDQEMEKLLGGRDRDGRGYAPGSYAAQNPIGKSAEQRLAEELSRFQDSIERSGNDRDRALRRGVLDRVTEGVAIDRAGLKGGLDVDRALAALESAGRTNRLQYATTGTDVGSGLAAAFGLPDKTEERTYYGKTLVGDRYNIEAGLQDLAKDARSGEMRGRAMEIDEILHPEKYEEPKTYSTAGGVVRVGSKGPAEVVPGTEPRTEQPGGGEPPTAKPVRDEETGDVLGHMVEGKFVKTGSGQQGPKVDAAELKRYTTRQTEIQNRLEELDRERAEGNKKSGPDWWFPGRNNFDQERQRLESEMAGIKAVLEGRPAGAPAVQRPEADNARPTPEQIRAELERRKAGR